MTSIYRVSSNCNFISNLPATHVDWEEEKDRERERECEGDGERYKTFCLNEICLRAAKKSSRYKKWKVRREAAGQRDAQRKRERVL